VIVDLTRTYTDITSTQYNPLKTESESESESELLYDWRFTASQFVLAPNPLRLTTRDYNRLLRHDIIHSHDFV
jgi:hypothetical protein